MPPGGRLINADAPLALRYAKAAGSVRRAQANAALTPERDVLAGKKMALNPQSQVPIVTGSGRMPAPLSPRSLIVFLASFYWLSSRRCWRRRRATRAVGKAARVGFDRGQHSATTVITSPLPGLFDVDRIARAAFASVRVDDLDDQGVLSDVSRFGLIPHDRSFAPLLVALKAWIALGKVREPGSWLHGPCPVLRLIDDASTSEGG